MYDVWQTEKGLEVTYSDTGQVIEGVLAEVVLEVYWKKQAQTPADPTTDN